MLEDYGLSEEKKPFSHWYDGFSLEKEKCDIYNPWSLTKYLIQENMEPTGQTPAEMH